MSVTWHKNTHGVPRRKETLDRMTTRLFLVAVGLATLLIGAYLTLTASTVHISNGIWKLHNELAEIQRTNSALEAEIARHSSIPVMQQRSEALRYEPATAVEFAFTGAP